MSKKIVSYSDAFTRLQEIQEAIESNRLDIDELGVVLKEASALLALCKEKLYKVNEETKKILDDIQ